VRFGVALLDAWPEFVAVRSRSNTVAAVAYDLKVFFTVVGKPPRRVAAAVCSRSSPPQYAGGQAPPTAAGRRRWWGVGTHDAAAAVERVGAVRVPARARRRRGEPGAARAADPPGTATAAPVMALPEISQFC
jgi:hypothetical protein